jgi:DnaK suppressor protein
MAIELEILRFNLEQERRRLIEELEQAKVNGNSDKEQYKAGSFYEREEAADVTTDLQRRIALETQKRNSLAGVEHALQKMDAGTYGICDNCGQPIDPARMEALPHAAYCMTCSTVLKNGVKKK